MCTNLEQRINRRRHSFITWGANSHPKVITCITFRCRDGISLGLCLYIIFNIYQWDFRCWPYTNPYWTAHTSAWAYVVAFYFTFHPVSPDSTGYSRRCASAWCYDMPHSTTHGFTTPSAYRNTALFVDNIGVVRLGLVSFSCPCLYNLSLTVGFQDKRVCSDTVTLCMLYFTVKGNYVDYAVN